MYLVAKPLCTWVNSEKIAVTTDQGQYNVALQHVLLQLPAADGQPGCTPAAHSGAVGPQARSGVWVHVPARLDARPVQGRFARCRERVSFCLPQMDLKEHITDTKVTILDGPALAVYTAAWEAVQGFLKNHVAYMRSILL